jgi:hypothetical protein
MDIFLRAKHWQLFLVMFVLPAILFIAIMATMLSSIVQNPNPDPRIILDHFKLLPLAIIFYAGTELCWQWTVGIRLQKFAPAGMVFKNNLFKIFAISIVVYLVLVFVFVFSTMGSFLSMTAGPPDPSFFIGFVAIMPLGLFATFCKFYCYYFAAKTYKTVELQREVSIGDFILEIVLIWFFFVGVWIMQPKINEMINREAAPADMA